MDAPESAARDRPLRLLVTGGSGQLGSALIRHSPPAWHVAGSHHTNPRTAADRRLDVVDGDAVRRLVDELRPDVIVHTAYRQSDPAMASVNVTGSANVAVAAHAAGARLVHLSTDVVFDGTRERGGYTERDQPSPITEYGRTKLAAERAVQAAKPDALIVRTSLIYGGAVAGPHERLVTEAVNGLDVGFFTDEWRCPVQVDDMAVALLELAMGELCGPLHVAGADAVSRFEFAQLVAAARGLDATLLRPALSSDQPARRPLNCELDCSLAEMVLSARPRGIRAVLAGAPIRR